VLMYETTGRVEFVYGTMTPSTGTTSASVGLTADASNFQSVTIASNTASTVTPDDANGGVPASGRF